mgnify:CR=1 FL=1
MKDDSWFLASDVWLDESIDLSVPLPLSVDWEASALTLAWLSVTDISVSLVDSLVIIDTNVLL